jgi:hypothetical protein
VVNVDNPSAPEIVGELAVDGGVDDVWAVGGYAFLTVDPPAVAVVDVRDPTAPAVVATMLTEGEAHGVTIDDGVAYVASGEYLETIALTCGAAGDGNWNGWIDPGDIEALLQRLYGGAQPLGNLDADGSGSLDSADLSALVASI